MTDEHKPFNLTKEEKDSALWKKLHGHLEGRLNVVRAENDSMHAENATNRLRGRIMAYKEIIALGDED